jgi:nucleotide-binding universal stress UspA family protein
MIGIRRIVAATDLSSPSRRAVERGFAIAARGEGVQYTVIHALGAALEPSALTRALGAEAGALGTVVRQRQESALQQLAKSAGARQGAVAETLVADGDAGDVIPTLAAAAAADLLVIGARGGGGLRRRLFGSTASRLLRRSPCPVLVVRSAVREPYRRLLVAVDLSPASVQAIRAAMQVAPDATVTLVTVWTMPYEDMLSHAGMTSQSMDGHRGAARDSALRQLHEVAAEAGLAAGFYAARVEGGGAGEGHPGCRDGNRRRSRGLRQARHAHHRGLVARQYDTAARVGPGCGPARGDRPTARSPAGSGAGDLTADTGLE